MGIVEPVKIVTLSWYLIFCAGKLSDVTYVPPWRIATGGGNLARIGSIKSGAWHPKWRLVVSARFLREAYLKSNRTFCDIFGMKCYAVFEADLLRWKIIRRNVCTAVGLS